MRSGYLYNAGRLEAFLKPDHAENFKHETFLSRIIAIEIAIQAIETSL
jgi:hypothetical protein